MKRLIIETLRKLPVMRSVDRTLTQVPVLKHIHRQVRALLLPAETKLGWMVHDWVADNQKFLRRHKLQQFSFAPDGVFVNGVDGVEYWYDLRHPAGTLGGVITGGRMVGIEIDIILKNLSPGAVFVDAGAGIGEYALNVGTKIEGAIVFCFEPTQESWEAVKRSVVRNRLTDRVSCYKLGLSDTEGTFRIATVADGAFVMKSDTEIDLSTFHSKETIRTTTLDKFVAEKSISRLDFVKVDVEGGELFMLKGAIESLEKFKPHLQLELVDWCATRLGYNIDEVFDYLDNLGYVYSCVVNETGRLHRLEPGHDVTQLLALGHNFFFHHKSRTFIV